MCRGLGWPEGASKRMAEGTGLEPAALSGGGFQDLQVGLKYDRTYTGLPTKKAMVIITVISVRVE